MNKRHFIKKAVSGMLAIALVLSMIIAVPAEAKTMKVLYTVKTVDYGINSNGNWYKSGVSTSSYNKKGQNTKHEYVGYDTDGSKNYSYKYTYTYDKKGRTKVDKDFESGKLTSVSKYSYKGRKTVVKQYDGNNKFIGKTVSTSSKNKFVSKYYDAKGNLTGRYESTNSKNKTVGKDYNAKGKLTYKWVSTFKNGKQKKSESTGYNEDGKVNYKYTTTYSYKGKTVTSTSIYKSGSNTNKSVAKYKSDKSGRPIYSWRKEYDSDGKLVSSYTYKYTKFKKGAAKGCVKEQIEYRNGEKYSKSVFTLKQFKVKVN